MNKDYMTDEEKEIILKLFPEAQIGYDNADQIIIYTGIYAEDQMPETYDIGGEG